ncbi:MAG: pilus assembly protein [Reyranella sp.]|uniref:TadE/TadG family type IV pilus assembly protein n=1 Tax=Reyranella sp. TaxID=1929291 RepID=UPI00272FB89A|nr:TadE/TadG family type IV pilus assembly protein [Reyranella sp.]MDP1964186.1 pilus assembly protein [Reyranella sp.]MDP2373701.1 pilus assembly protein [Reyranella sp.]
MAAQLGRGRAACLSRLAGDQRGVSILEFALVAPLLLTMTIGAIDVGRMFYVRQGLEYATEEAARYFMLNPSAATSAVTTQLQGKMPGSLGPSVNVAYADTASCNGNGSVTCTTITATYSFSFAIGYLGAAKTLRATAQAVRLF